MAVLFGPYRIQKALAALSCSHFIELLLASTYKVVESEQNWFQHSLFYALSIAITDSITQNLGYIQ